MLARISQQSPLILTTGADPTLALESLKCQADNGSLASLMSRQMEMSGEESKNSSGTNERRTTEHNE